MRASKSTRTVTGLPRRKVDSHSLEEREFRRVLSDHNRQVIALAVVGAFGSALGWSVLYAVSYLAALIGAALSNNLDFDTPIHHFNAYFAAGVLALLGGALLDDYYSPDDGARDQRLVLEIIASIVFALPRMTIAVVKTLLAYRQPKPELVQLALEITRRVEDEKRVPVSRIALSPLDRKERDRVIQTLVLLNVLEIRTDEEGSWLSISSLNPLQSRLAGRALPDF